MSKELCVIVCLTAVSVGMMIGGFFCPPMGVIDGSVLTGCGILLAFSALWVAVIAIVQRGGTATFTHGDTHIEVKGHTDDAE